ncbi:MAG: diguanylate cyclase [Gammaproteobacteria bacterium]|nr:diguanylate cyclase [Gammaproteobacteria bacterium]
MKILSVDDSKTSLFLLKSYLEKMGHTVIQSDDPFNSIQLFRDCNPDLVVLDVMMEGMNGYECARQIREINCSDNDWVPIIFLSALVDDASVAEGIEAGGDDYLLKPFSEITLSAKIKAMERIANMRAQLKTANDKLNQISLTDALTNVSNRRAFDLYLEEEASRARRLVADESKMGLIIMDIDYFKAYNDHYGHQGGDECLQKVAAVLSETLKRRHENIFRYGGEEFAAIIFPATEEQAMQVAEKLRQNVEGMALMHAPDVKAKNITISLGVCVLAMDENQTKKDLIEKADQALYQAKKLGRNQTCLAKK